MPQISSTALEKKSAFAKRTRVSVSYFLSFCSSGEVSSSLLKLVYVGIVLSHLPMSYRLARMKAEAKTKRKEREQVENMKSEQKEMRKEALAIQFKEWTVDISGRIPVALVTRVDLVNTAMVVPDSRKRKSGQYALEWQQQNRRVGNGSDIPWDQGAGRCLAYPHQAEQVEGLQCVLHRGLCGRLNGL